MTVYYNEFDAGKAHMLRQLMADGHIAPGYVDERSIRDVRPEDLIGFTQCHFFAGIGGWSIALRLAGWPDDRPVWTGSCPCQSYSTAGKRAGQQDERHLWPDWYRLIAERKPPTVYGEQVAAAIAFGWWDDVAANLEAAENACAAAVLPACCVGKPHKRYRLFFVAHSTRNDDRGNAGKLSGAHEQQEKERPQGWNAELIGAGEVNRDVANTSDRQFQEAGRGQVGRNGERNDAALPLADTKRERREWRSNPAESAGRNAAELVGLNVGVTIGAGLERFAGHEQGWREPGRFDSESNRSVAEANTIWLECPDGKYRAVIDGIRLLVDGLHGRIPIIAAFGDAIVPEIAAHFIIASEGWGLTTP